HDREGRGRARGVPGAGANRRDPPGPRTRARDRVVAEAAAPRGFDGVGVPVGPRRQGSRDRPQGPRRSVTELEHGLRNLLTAGKRIFVPYVTGGLPGVDVNFLGELEGTGADVIEVGIPFSDPVMDGPVIQESSRRALEAGTTPSSVLELIKSAQLTSPAVVMTYLNPVLATGIERF